MSNQGDKWTWTANIEELAVRIAHLDREGLMGQLRQLKCSFELDFTDEFLASLSVDRLRHILLAAALHTRQAGRMPA